MQIGSTSRQYAVKSERHKPCTHRLMDSDTFSAMSPFFCTTSYLWRCFGWMDTIGHTVAQVLSRTINQTAHVLNRDIRTNIVEVAILIHIIAIGGVTSHITLQGRPPPDKKSRGCCCCTSRPNVIDPDYDVITQNAQNLLKPSDVSDFLSLWRHTSFCSDGSCCFTHRLIQRQ